VADECSKEKKAHDRAKNARERAWDRYTDKLEEAAKHRAEAARELGSMGNCVDIWGMPLPGCFSDHAARSQYAQDQADEAIDDAYSYLDEWFDALEAEEELEDEYCECLNRQPSG
jgi:hypothetical protein